MIQCKTKNTANISGVDGKGLRNVDLTNLNWCHPTSSFMFRSRVERESQLDDH